MMTFKMFLRPVAIATVSVGLLATTGCKHMSQGVRSQDVLDDSAIPPSPPEFRNVAPQLQPVPRHGSTNQYPPLAAPPSESASIDSLKSRIVEDEGGWDWDEEELADGREADEYFPVDVPSAPSELALERTHAAAARLAQQGQAATTRRWEQLPLIVPATPLLRPVSAEEPALKPVPKN